MGLVFQGFFCPELGQGFRSSVAPGHWRQVLSRYHYTNSHYWSPYFSLSTNWEKLFILLW